MAVVDGLAKFGPWQRIWRQNSHLRMLTPQCSRSLDRFQLFTRHYRRRCYNRQKVSFCILLPQLQLCLSGLGFQIFIENICLSVSLLDQLEFFLKVQRLVHHIFISRLYVIRHFKGIFIHEQALDSFETHTRGVRIELILQHCL